MKYIYIVSCLIIGLFLFLFIFIPKEINESVKMLTSCESKTLKRIIAKENKETMQVNNISFALGVSDFLHPTLILQHKTDTIHVTLYNYPTNKGENEMLGSYSLVSNGSFIQRLSNYFNRAKLKKNVKEVMSSLVDKCEDQISVYGGRISEVRLQDSTLLFSKNVTTTYPTTDQIYDEIEKLASYAQSFGAKQTNAPMLNAKKMPGDSTKYVFSVALPIDKELPSTKDITTKRMFAGGKFLLLEITGGGYHTIQKMEKNLENYLNDHTLLSPAIPFQSLVTNRVQEKDTAKWNTKLYYPIY